MERKTLSTKTGMKASGPTVISLFVTNLRLLDLDRLADWPGITFASFGNQDARARTRCTEFALFQLFRLYDAAITADKLQPFWPPLEPLQSINLRAALYRCLNELKKNGVLGKETVLRKTMLDECNGDKLWELCLAFSALVLKKVTLARRKNGGRPVAEKLGTAQGVTQSERSSMLPLSIAHKASLARVLEEKKMKKQTFVRLYDLLAEKEVELAQRKRTAQDQMRSRPSKQSQERLDAVERNVKKHWVGSPELQTMLLNGDTNAGSDVVLTGSLDQIANSSVAEPRERSLLEALSRSNTRQSQRVHRWQSMNENSHAVKSSSAKPEGADDMDAQPIRLRLDRHRSLSTKGESDKSAEPPRRRSKSNAGAARYDEILTAMRDELRHTRRHDARSISAPGSDGCHDQPMRRSSVVQQLHTGAGAIDPLRFSPSQTAMPARPMLSARISSRSRSYQQPKVDSQRQPIPLKSELFSPLKVQRRGSHSPLTGSMMLASPVEEEYNPLRTASFSSIVVGDVRRRSQSSDISGAVDSGIGLGISSTKQSISDESTSGPVSEGDETTAPSQARPSTTTPEPHHIPTRPSLAERTRISLAFRSREDFRTVIVPEEPPIPLLPAEYMPETVQPSPENNNPLVDRRTSLADRTLHSISSLAPSSTPTYQRKAHSRTRSSIMYPINQFDTPAAKKARRSSIGLGSPPRSSSKRDITPREQLFSPDAEYDSVFKPRPKVALSPVGSPAIFAAAGGGEEFGGGHLTEREAVRRSPLLGR